MATTNGEGNGDGDGVLYFDYKFTRRLTHNINTLIDSANIMFCSLTEVSKKAVEALHTVYQNGNVTGNVIKVTYMLLLTLAANHINKSIYL